MPLKRTSTWERALHDFILSRAHAPFQHGLHDCALFACDGIQAMTGVDIAEDMRGYTTEAGAFKAIRKITGGSTVEDAADYCAQKYGLAEYLYPLMAQRGDLVLVDHDGMRMALIHPSGVCAVAPGDVGLLRIPLTAITRAWSTSI
jgi:hypothetical protein